MNVCPIDLQARRAHPAPDPYLPVIGKAMSGIVATLRVFARQEETILLTGPTGAGKTRLALWCHAHSGHGTSGLTGEPRPFEVANLATVPENLQLAELFGWRKGAFSGAVTDNPGYVGRAQHGTLFIDEIDKLSLETQAGLLRLLDERKYRPLGPDEKRGPERQADVRFLIGSNADLGALVRSGGFLEDLYYRINVLPVRVPPLAERTDEIPLWGDYMATVKHRSMGRAGIARFSPEAHLMLMGQPWPGNLRQLDSVVRRAYARAAAAHERTPDDLLIELEHVRAALAFEIGAGKTPLVDAMRSAAAAIVSEAERRRESGAVLDLAHTGALDGFVLREAVQRLGGKREAFLLFGQTGLVSSRNHFGAYNRAIKKAKDLCRELGVEDEWLEEGGKEEA